MRAARWASDLARLAARGGSRALGLMTPTAWDIGALKAHLHATLPDSSHACELLRSISHDGAIFRYHMATARDALKGIVNDAHPTGPESLLLALGGSGKRDEFEYAKVVSEAHLIGCLHTARSMWDHIAQVLNALLLAKPLPVADCDIAKVAAALSVSPLKEQIDEVLTSHWYRYIAAFINTVKHRHLVEHMFTVSLEHDRAGVRIGAFSYGSRAFDAYWGTEVLEGAIEVKNGVVASGRLLNQLVIRA
jgi:hypothetical protein